MAVSAYRLPRMPVEVFPELNAPTVTVSEVDANDPLQLRAGDRVTVAPDDYGIVPVAGELVRLTVDDIAVRREDRRAGEVVVNFPRRGYKVAAA